MKNEEKYKTADERGRAFTDFCDLRDCSDCELQGRNHCLLSWLEMEVPEEKPLPCPFCGSECGVLEIRDEFYVGCANEECDYSSGNAKTTEAAIAAHNRIAKAVMDAKEGGQK